MIKLGYFAFLIYIALIVSGINNFLSEKFNSEAFLSPFILFLSLVIIIYYLQKGERSRVQDNSVTIFYILFFSYLILGGLTGLSEGKVQNVFRAYRFYLPTIIIFWAGILGFYGLFQYRSVNFILNVCRWTMLVNILVVLFNYLTNSTLFVIEKEGSDISGFLLNPNFAGFSANLLLAIELYFLRETSSRLSYVIIPLVLASILIGFSRSAMLTSFIILIANSFIRNDRATTRLGQFRVAVFLAIFALVISIWFEGFIGKVFEIQSQKYVQIQNLLNGEITKETTGLRLFLAEIGWEKIKASPLIGHGLHTFNNFEGYGSGVHNQYLLIWGESGIIPFILYVAFHIYLMFRANGLPRNLKIMLWSFITAILIFSFTNHSMFANKNYIVIVCLIIVLIFIYKESEKQEVTPCQTDNQSGE